MSGTGEKEFWWCVWQAERVRILKQWFLFKNVFCSIYSKIVGAKNSAFATKYTVVKHSFMVFTHWACQRCVSSILCDCCVLVRYIPNMCI